MTAAILCQKECAISHPKTFTESLNFTKVVTSVMLSHVLIDRKLFKDSKYNKRSIFGVPVKIIKCKNAPELKFFFCLRTAMKDLTNKNLQSISLVIASKVQDEDLEEYSIRYKYGDDQIGIEFSKGEECFGSVSEDQEENKKIKESIEKVLENEKCFINSVPAIPGEFVIKLRLTYNENADIAADNSSKYFKWKPIEATLKDSCSKVKIGKTQTKFHSSLFTARSSLLKCNTSGDDEEIPAKRSRERAD